MDTTTTKVKFAIGLVDSEDEGVWQWQGVPGRRSIVWLRVTWTEATHTT